MTSLDNGGSRHGAERCVPRHVAIIMDGNGRWAAMRGLPRFQGHRQGMESVRAAVRHARDVGISYLTLYSFSSENWSRPAQEVSDLMGLLKLFIRRELAELNREGVRIRVIGSRDGIPADIMALLDDAVAQTAANAGLTLIIAFNYGGRDEITRAVAAIGREIEAGRLSAAQVTPQLIGEHLDTAGIPDPDLLIRTSGELRLSNFLLWQCAYSELVFLDAYWPEFNAELFNRALEEYRSRERRFGGLQARSAG